MIQKTYVPLIALLLAFSSIQVIKAQNNEILDPLNLMNEDRERTPAQPGTYKKAYITAISADNEENKLVITGVPEVHVTTESVGREVRIEILNAVLHPSIANRSYNWNYKLSSQYREIVSAEVVPNSYKRTVAIELKFLSPVTIDVVQKKASRLEVFFTRIENLPPENDYLSNVPRVTQVPDNYNRQIKSDYNSDSVKIKPSGRYIVVKPGSSKLSVPTKIQQAPPVVIAEQKPIAPEGLRNAPEANTPSASVETGRTGSTGKEVRFSPDVEEHLSNIPPDLPLPDGQKPETSSPVISAPQPYQRSENDYSEVPSDLPTLDRPEMIENDLLEKNDYDDILRIAVSLETQGQYDDSIQKYLQAITLDPGRYEAYSALGDVYLKQKNYKLAVENYEKALELNPGIVKAMFNLAVSYNNLDLYDNALVNFKKVLEIQPGNFEANYHLANIHFLLNDFPEALSYYEKSLELAKKSKNNFEIARINYNIANTYKAQKTYTNAVRYYKEAIKLYKEFADAHYNLAATYVDMNEPKKAIEQFKEYQKYVSSAGEISRIDQIISQLKENS
jgi:Tfp pilus assembly protein PilF